MVKNAASASQSLQEIAVPLEETRTAIKDIDGQLAGLKDNTAFGEVFSRIESLEERTKDLAQSHDQATSSLAATLHGANDLEERLTGLHQVVSEVSDARDDLVKLSGPAGMVVKLKEQIARLEDQIREVEKRGDGLRDVTFRIEVAETRAKEVTAEQIELAKALEKTLGGVEELEAKFTDLADLEGRLSGMRSDIERLATAHQETAEFLGPSGMMAKLRDQSENLRRQLAEYGGQIVRVREDQSDIRSSQERALSKYDEVRSHLDGLNEEIGKATARLSSVEVTMRDLSKAEELASRTERHLNALWALSDHVTQKSAALEMQREVVDRAEAQLRNLTDIQQSLRTQLQKAQEQVKEIKKGHSNLEKLRSLNSEVSGRTAELHAEQARIDKGSEELREQLTGLQEEVRLGAERFRLESGGLEAIGQRIVDLRGGATHLEGRFQVLDSSVARITEASDQADVLAARLATLSSGLAQMGEQVERVEGMRGGMERAEDIAVEVANRLERIEAKKADIDEAMRDLTSLRGAREEVRDSLEQLRGARADIERLQVGNAETSAWLSTVQDSIREIRVKIASLGGLTENVERMRQNADRVMSAASSLDARSDTLAVLETRMTELQRIGTQLAERTSNLLSSLDDVDHRFKKVAERADEADRVSGVIGSVTAKVEQAERRMGVVGEGVQLVTHRAEAMEVMSKRVDVIATEIEQRQQALDSATEQLERVAGLRSEATEVVQSLEDRLRALSAELQKAEAQSAKVGTHAERLEARVGSLRFAEKRLTQFEEKLARLDQTEQELARSLGTLEARQEMVNVVKEDLQQLFRMAEQTLEDVGAIAAARDEVEEARGVLDVVLGKTEQMDQLMGTIQGHQQQIEAAETRLTQAQALLMDIRAGLQTLGSQKAVVDHVIEQSGQLAFEVKEAEALLDSLRREREMTQRIHDAVKELRDDDSAARAS